MDPAAERPAHLHEGAHTAIDVPRLRQLDPAAVAPLGGPAADRHDGRAAESRARQPGTQDLAELRRVNAELQDRLNTETGLRRMTEFRLRDALEELQIMCEELQRAGEELRRAYDALSGR
jgi:hypothetical protein